MSTRDAVIRRIGFWAAVLTGVALVGSQFACANPQSLLAAPGFPRASRLTGAPTTPAAHPNLADAEVGVVMSASEFWTASQSDQNAGARMPPENHPSQGSTQTRVIP